MIVGLSTYRIGRILSNLRPPEGRKFDVGDCQKEGFMK